MAWDSRTMCGTAHFEGEHQKVFANGEVIFASAGDVRRINALTYMDVPPVEDWDVDRYVHTSLVPAMLEVFAQKLHGDDYPDGETLAVVRGRVYEIGNDGVVTRRTDSRYAIGSGAPYALGALRSNADIRKVLEVAAYFDAGTGGRIHIAQDKQLLAERTYA